MLGHGANDSVGKSMKIFIRKAVVPPAAPDGSLTAGLQFECFRILSSQPRRHDRRRRADNRPNIVLLGELQPAVEPIELILSFFRLK